MQPAWQSAARVCYIPPRTERLASNGGRVETDRWMRA